MSSTLCESTNWWKEMANAWLQNVLPFLGLFVALLMVSRIRYPQSPAVFARTAEFGICGHRIFLCRGFSAGRLRGAVVGLGICVYGPIHLAWEKWYQRRHREEPLF